MLQFFGLLSGILAILGYIPYIKDTLQLKTKPQRTTFLIWSILGAIAFFSQLAKGALYSLWLPGSETLLTVAVFLLSLKRGVGGFNKKDYIALVVTLIGLLVWYYTKEAAVALYSVIIVDAAGGIFNSTQSISRSRKRNIKFMDSSNICRTFCSACSWEIRCSSS